MGHELSKLGCIEVTDAVMCGRTLKAVRKTHAWGRVKEQIDSICAHIFKKPSWT